MPGLPKDTFEKDIETAKKSIEMKPDICRIYPSLVIKDTPMEEMYKRGIYKPYTLEEAVEISRILYEMYIEAGIKVIRMGLQPTDSINVGGDIVDGPFHPAFRELVLSNYLVKKIKDTLKEKRKGTIMINPRDISMLYANKKVYFNKLKEEGYSIKVIQREDIKRGDYIIE